MNLLIYIEKIFKNAIKRTVNRFIIFLFFILLLSYFLGLFDLLYLRPSGAHYWRQTDGLSFVTNYYSNGYDFFHPEIYLLDSNNGKGASEFPIYYFIAALAIPFGLNHEIILRLLHFFTMFLGVFALSEICLILTKQYLLSILISLNLFASGLLAYYAMNFLPDTPALGFTFIGCWALLKYLNNKKDKWFLFAFIVFTLALLIKISLLFIPLAVIVFILAEKTAFYKIYTNVKCFKHNIVEIIIAAISFLIVFAWNFWVIYYNKINGSTYFTLAPLPIWQLSGTEISDTFDMLKLYVNSIYQPTFFHILGGLLVLSIILFRKQNLKFWLWNLVITIGWMCYALLFFAQFKYHDYYLLNAFIVLAFWLLLFIKTITDKINNSAIRWKYLVLLLFLTAFFIMNLFHAQLQVEKLAGFNGRKCDSVNPDFYSIEKYLDEKSFPSDAKIISLPDRTTNASLYFMRRKGWTISVFDMNEENINKFIKHGANFLVVDSCYKPFSHEPQADFSPINKFMQHEWGKYGGIRIYDLSTFQEK